MQDWANYPRDNSFTHYSFISGEIYWVLITIMAALVHGHFKVKRCTSKKKSRAILLEYPEWITKVRSHLPKRELMRVARKEEIQGHFFILTLIDVGKRFSLA